MERKRMLFVEDDRIARNEATQSLNHRGWNVEYARDGEQALQKIRSKGTSYDVIVLDLKMQNMGGEEVLERIQDEKLQVPPIIVFSAWADQFDSKCRYLGAAHVINKPFDPADLSNVASLFAMGSPVGNSRLEFDDELLSYMVKRRESSLYDVFYNDIDRQQTSNRIDEPIFIVGRRWNSWYPSVFPVPGGSYSIITPAPLDCATDDGKTSNGIIIDPGFRFLEILRKLGLSLSQMDSFVITHNHPDHLGGVFELMAARHVLGKETRAFCSQSVCEMLGNCTGFNLELKKLDDKYHDLIKPYQTKNDWLRIRIKGFNTAHEEIGREDSSQGLCISIDRGTNSNNMQVSNELIVLGDTEYDRAEHRDSLIPSICNPNVKIVILHIGSSQLKQKTGKHLYLNGLRNILSDMESQLIVNKYQGNQIVIISEWGLEHASRSQIEKICGKSLDGFNDYSPILETIRALQKGLTKIQLVPGDIGLRVGMETGNVYIDNGSIVNVDNLKVNIDEDGLSYQGKS